MGNVQNICSLIGREDYNIGILAVLYCKSQHSISGKEWKFINQK